LKSQLNLNTNTIFISVITFIVFIFGAIENVNAQTTSFTSNPAVVNDTIKICAGQSITYTNTSTGVITGQIYNWVFSGGSSTSYSTIGPHTVSYPTSGTYTASLTVGPSSSSHVVLVQPGVTGNILSINQNINFNSTNSQGITTFLYCGTAIPYSASVPFTFQINNSVFPSGATLNIDWGDGSTQVVTSGASSVPHTYSGSITNLHILTLTITTSLGCIFTQTYHVFQGVAPTINLSGNGQNACIPYDYDFLLLSNNVPNTTYIINFNDGSIPDTLTVPFNSTITHTFNFTSCGTTSSTSSTGTYNNAFQCGITAINSCASTSVTIAPIYVSQSVQASTVVTPSNIICQFDTINISNTSFSGMNTYSGDCDSTQSYFWDIQPTTGFSILNGTYGSSNTFLTDFTFWSTGSSSLAIQFLDSGVYEIELMIANGCGLDSVTQTITVNPTPVILDYQEIICTGGSFDYSPVNNPPNALVPTGTTYAWTVSNNLNITGASSGSGSSISDTLFNNASNTDTAVYTVIPTINGCDGAPFYITVIVVPGLVLPDFTQTICNGGSISFSPINNPPSVIVPTGTIYTWTVIGNPNVSGASSGSGTVITDTLTSSIITPLQSVVYNVIGQSGTTCAADSFNLTVNINTISIPTIDSNQTICSGGDPNSIIFSTVTIGTGALSYQWQSSTNLTGTFNNLVGDTLSYYDPPVGISSTTFYRVIVFSNLNGVMCSQYSNIVTVTVNPLPTITGTLALCVGNTTALTGSVTADTTTPWISGTPTVATITSAGVVTGVSAGISVITYMNTNGCTQTVTVTVNPLPVVNAGTSITLCDQAISYTLTGYSPTTGNTGVWTGANVTSGGVFTPNGVGNAVLTYTFTSANSCVNSDTMIVTVVAPQVANAGIGFDICVNASIYTLTGFTPSGGTWTGVGIASNSFNPTTAGTGTHILTYSFGSGTCLSTDTIIITVNPVATANANIPQTVCAGETITLAGTIGGSATSGTWSAPSGSFSSASSLTSSYTPSILNGTVTLTLTTNDPLGPCPAVTSTMIVTVNPIATANANIGQTVCGGGTITLAGSIGGSATSATWSATSGSFSSASSLTSSYTPSILSGTVTLTLTTNDPTGPCPAVISTMIVTVNPVATANANIAQTVCAGETIILAGTIGGSATSGTWSAPSGSFSDVSSLTSSYTPSILNGTVTLTLTTNNPLGPCPAVTSTMIVTVNPLPVVNAGMDQAVCNGASVTLSGTGATTYIWNNGVTNGMAFAPATTTTYTLTGTSVAGCINTDQVVVTVNPLPVVNAGADTTLCSGASGTIGTTSTSGYTYSWSPTTGLSSSLASNPTVTLTNANTSAVLTTYTVTTTITATGCTSLDAVIVTINPTPTVNDPLDQLLCNATSSTLVTFSGSVTGTSYTWTNSNTSIGLAAASGTGNIAAFTSINTGTTPTTSTVVVTPSYTNSGATCPGLTQSFIYTVNPTPSVQDPVDLIACNGGTVSAVTFTGTGTSYTWINSAASIGLAASGTGNITSFTATNNGSNPIVATVTVTPQYTNGGLTCLGSAQSMTITVNPSPSAQFNIPNQTICSQGISTGVNISSTTSNAAITWAVPTIPASVTGLNTTSGTTIIPSMTLTNTSSSPVVITFLASATTPGALTCPGSSANYTITVNPSPEVNDPIDQLLCNATASAAVIFVGSGSSYTWTNSNTGIGLAASGLGNISSFTAVNTGSTVITSTLVVTPIITNNSVNCPGTTQSFTYTINPTPGVASSPDFTLCNGESSSIVSLSGTGTSYPWTNSNTAIGLAASGTDFIPSFQGVNVSNGPITGNITVTPLYTNGGLTCQGIADQILVTINPTPTVLDPLDQVVCNNSSTSGIIFSGNATSYTWTNSTSGIGLAASGTGTITPFTPINTGTSPIIATVNVTPQYTGTNLTCPGLPQSFTFTINSSPIVANPIDQTVCNGVSTSLVNFSGTGMSYTWTNNTPGIGLAASGIGNINPFTAINTSLSPLNAQVVVTPNSTGNGLTCSGVSQDLIFTINPTPGLIDPTDQVVCNGTATAATVFSGNGTSYSWTNSNPAIGLTASGLGNIPSFTAINTGNIPIVTTITVLPNFTGGAASCNGVSQSYTITVNPTPNVQGLPDQVLCNSATTNALNFVGTGTSYTWTNNTPSIGLAGSGTGNIAAFTAVNTGSTIVAASITVTPQYSNAALTCSGATQSITITVNPTPTVIVPQNLVLCNGANSSQIILGGTGTSYNWTNSNPSIGLAASATGNIPVFVAVNLANGPVSSSVSISPIYTFGGQTCTGTSQNFNIIINPTPTIVAPLDQILCNQGLTTTVSFVGTGNLYTWINSNPGIGLAANGSGNISSFTASNISSTPSVATITATPQFSNSGLTCAGLPQQFTIQVNPTAIVLDTADQVYCNGSIAGGVTFSGTATNYTWTNDNTNIGLASNGVGNIPTFTVSNNSSLAITANLVVTPLYTIGSLVCPGPVQNFVFTVNPTPLVNDPLDQVICNGLPTTAVNFVGTGTSYNWTNSQTSIGLNATGTGNILPFNAMNANSSAVISNIVVTPQFTGSGVTCSGNPQNFNITVNPSPNLLPISPISICNNTAFNVNLASDLPSYFVWQALATSNVNGEVSSAQTSSVINNTLTNITTIPQNVQYTVTPTSIPQGCVGTSLNFAVTVIPDVILSIPTAIEICSGSAVNALLTANVSSNFSWFTTFNNPNVTGESITVNTGAIINDILINNSATNQLVIYSVTPTSINGSCLGLAQTVAVTVKPPLALLNNDTVTICSGSSVALSLVSNTAVTFNWFAQQSLAVQGESISTVTSATITDTLFSTSTITEEVLYNVVASSTATGCSTPMFPIHVFVNPIPNIIAVPDLVFCQGLTTTNISLDGAVSGTSFNWTNTNTLIGLPASGLGSISPFVGQNTTISPIVSTVSVVPSFVFNGVQCQGNPEQFTITINPIPDVVLPIDQNICAGSPTTSVIFNGTVPNTIYSWQNNNLNTGLGTSGIGNINSYITPIGHLYSQTSTITITPNYTNAGVTCSGPIENFNISVNPTALLTTIGDTICSKSDLNLPITTSVPANIIWQATNNINVSGESLAPQNSLIITDILTNNGASPEIVNYQVSLSTAGFGCLSGPFNLPVLVNLLPQVDYTVLSAPLRNIDPIQFQNNTIGNNSYIWSFGDGNNSTLFSPAHTYLNAGSYSVNLTAMENNTGCIDSVIKVVNIDEIPEIQFAVSNDTGCIVLNTVFTDIVNAPNTQLYWDFGDGTNSNQSNSIDHQYNDVGCFDVSLTITNASGCVASFTETNFVCVYEQPVAHFYALPDSANVEQPEIAFINQSVNASTYYWDFGDGTNSVSVSSIHDFGHDIGNYSVTLYAYSLGGCYDSMFLTVNIYEDIIYYVPNTFTPNFDGTNDIFLPILSSGLDLTNYKLLIFNRWGEVVFESNDPSVGWNGTFLNRRGHLEIAQDDTYTWKIRMNALQNEEAIMLVGHVTLLK